MTNDLKRVFAELSDVVSDEAKRILIAIIDAEDYSSSAFSAPVVLSCLEDRQPLWGKKGIYVFLLNEDVVMSYDEIRRWSSKCIGAGFFQWEEKDLKKGDCLYLGSCVSLSLYTRIGQHFADNGQFTSLKLNHPTRKKLCDKVKVIAFPLKNDMKQYCRLLLPLIERELHEELNPKCGSKRV